MEKITKSSLFNLENFTRETRMDKTTRIVKIMLEVDEEKRRIKLMRLRKARMERDVNTPKKSQSSSANKIGFGHVAKKKKQ